MTEARPVHDGREAVDALSKKLGVAPLVLGGMHFFNLAAISEWRRRARLGGRPTKVADKVDPLRDASGSGALSA
jgi:hypothetical protein